MRLLPKLLLPAACWLVLAGCQKESAESPAAGSQRAAAAGEVNLYTTREPGLIQPLLDAFTAETGIQVNTVFLKDGLMERLNAEGERSTADVLMTVDSGNLLDVVEAGHSQPLKSKVLEAAIPAHLRGAEGEWFALSLRDRVVYADKDMNLPTGLTYQDLALPAYKGKLCIRSGQHPYNTSLIAAMIAHEGEAKTESWLRGIKANLARKPAGGDRDVARDILAGICDLGLANTYYVGRMKNAEPGSEQHQWGEAIKVVRPSFGDFGTHVNISGAVLAKHAPNRDNAVRLMEYLVSDQAQAMYAKANYEYPVKAGVPLDPVIEALGPLQVDTLPMSEIQKHRRAASELVDKVGFDQ
ncbi:iron ABC transporter substrate-binding protein [Lysobacteraceae bacterium NML120232]|nr:iron ABC transporter substrate-binding protein [Xanthomonadaceae bacterium NML120232]